MTTYRKTSGFRLDGITGVLILLGFIVAMYFIIKYTLIALTFVAPLLLIATLIIDHTVVTNYLKWIGSTLKTNLPLGIGAILVTIFGYALVFPFLFGKALLKKRFKQAQQEYEKDRQGELIDFEEIESKPNREKPLELPQLKKQPGGGNAYDKYFEQ
ncbi:MAG: hypothetical protein IT258_11610 [Saprospiraceae bacterium]|nr:hypothetical protein [Saprospiraceae bacterium]